MPLPLEKLVCPKCGHDSLDEEKGIVRTWTARAYQRIWGSLEGTIVYGDTDIGGREGPDEFQCLNCNHRWPAGESCKMSVSDAAAEHRHAVKQRRRQKHA